MTTDTKVAELPNVGVAAQARRLYMHVRHGGSATATDIAWLVETIERLEAALARQEAVAWRYWNEKSKSWNTTCSEVVAGVMRDSGRAVEPLYAAPPAAQAVDLPDDFSESKDWRESDYNGRVDWLKEMHASQRAEIVRLQNDVEILRALIDQQAGKGNDRAK